MSITLADIEGHYADLAAATRAAIADRRITLGEAVGLLAKAADTLVNLAAVFGTLSGAQKKALVDQAVVRLYREVIAPRLSLWWPLSPLVHAAVERAIPYVTQAVYETWKKHTKGQVQ